MGSGDQKDFLFKSNKNQNAHLNRLVSKLSDNMQQIERSVAQIEL